MAFTLDTTMGEILDNPQARAALDQFVPGASSHPMIGMARGLTLNMILLTPQAAQFGLTREKVEQVLAKANLQIG